MTVNGGREYQVTVEGIGTFTVARRTMRHEFRIAAEYSRLTEGVAAPADYLDRMASWVAALKVLVIDAPEGWDIDAMDPLDDASFARIGQVIGAVRVREDEFRGRKAEAGEAAGA